MTDPRRRPDEFLDEVRGMRAHREQYEPPPLNPAVADQTLAAHRDARRLMDQVAGVVVDVEPGEREEALVLALGAAAARRGLLSRHRPDSPRPELVDLAAGGRARHCDVCETRAYRLERIHAQYGQYIFCARVCVRCRRWAPEPVDDAA
jgi:hypothetical protein